MPFQFPEGRRLFVGPVVLMDISFNIEVSPSNNNESLKILPGEIIVGEKVVVQTELYRQFRIGKKHYHFKKGSIVFVFKPASEGKILFDFNSLHVCLVGAAGQRLVVLWRKEKNFEEFQYAGAVVHYQKKQFFIKSRGDEIEKRLLIADATRGIDISKKGKITSCP